MNLSKKTARQAGFLYLLASLTALPGLLYVPGKLFVRGDMTATANHLRASDGLLRLGVGSELCSHIIFIYLVVLLYRLFRPVNEGQASLMAILILVSLPIVFINVLTEIAAAALVGGEYSAVFDRAQLDALAYLLLRLHSRGFAVAEIFWGLWLFPFAIVVIQSGFIPRVLGYLLIIAGCGYLLDSLTVLFVPGPSELAHQIARLLTAGELPIIFWLLIWGTKQGSAATTQPVIPD